jgi:protein-tyrosine phosphatase
MSAPLCSRNYGIPMYSALYVIETGTPGRLATMAHPRGGGWLDDEMAGLREAGVDVLVSALRPDEYQLLDLVGEPAAAREAGLDFVAFPVPDMDIPEALPPALDLTARLAGEVRAGRFVVAHCRAGIGRCSMLAGATLIRLGATPAEAWQRIRRARGLPVPDNARQEDWLYRFAEALRDGG